jgi:hypothetical protein
MAEAAPRNAHCILCGDNDAAGRDHVALVAKHLHGVARRLRVLDLAKFWPDIEESDDISDWLAAGHARDELGTLVDQAPDYRGEAQDGRAFPFTLAKDITIEPKRFLIVTRGLEPHPAQNPRGFGGAMAAIRLCPQHQSGRGARKAGRLPPLKRNTDRRAARRLLELAKHG